MAVSYNLANWLRQTTASTGIGPLTMGAAVSDPASITMAQAFGSAGVTPDVVYSIEDNGVEVEAGVGSYDGPSGVFTRGPTATLVGGVYTEGSPALVALVGPVIVRVTLNSVQFQAVLTAINARATVFHQAGDPIAQAKVGDVWIPI